MANFPGSDGALPGVYDTVEVISSGASVPGSTRLACIMGEGLRSETLVASASGSGADGLSTTWLSTGVKDGRHFQVSVSPLVPNRAQLFKNGIPLNGIEQAITSTFDGLYDYEIEASTGKILLQGAIIQDQGGNLYVASALNVGNGFVNNLTLVDPNAPTETWSIRCVSIHRDTNGNPVDGYAQFIAQGSVSGILLDGYGNQVTWQSNNTLSTNGVLSFSISESSIKFHEGDKFSIKVKGGALVRGDSLVANYIAVSDINQVELFTDLNSLTKKHGLPTTSNKLSLGAQLAFANNPPGLYTCQCAPSVPRRLSYTLRTSATGNSNSDDLEFRLPIGIDPDPNANVHFFVTDPITQTETQLIPNKVAFYQSGFTASPASFENSTHTYSYTVILDPIYEQIAEDEHGTITFINSTHITISSSTYIFDAEDATATRRVKILTPDTNAGIYQVVSVSGGAATLVRVSGSFIADASTVKFEVLDTSASGAVVLFTKDLALTAGQSLRATVVDTKDSSFFDVSWINAYQALERFPIRMVVPLPSQTISAIFAEGRSHVEFMSDTKNRKERILLIGAINGLTPDNVIGNTDAAVEDIGVLEGIQGDSVSEILAGAVEDLADYSVPNSYGSSYRVVYFYPDQIVVQIGADNTIIDGFFIAAAAAGYLSGLTLVSLPLTNKVLTGFTILNDRTYRPVVLEQIVGAGVCVLTPVQGGGNVVWGLTTSQDGTPEHQEIAIVMAIDELAYQLRGMMSGYVGQIITPTVINSMSAKLLDGLSAAVGQLLISDFKGQSVSVDPIDPRQINCTLIAKPAYSVNWIYIKIGVGNF